MSTAKFVTVLFLAIVFLSAVEVMAEQSNVREVRGNLDRDGWVVIWGHNFTEGDWAEGLAAIAGSVASENPGPFLKWFEYKLDQIVDQFKSKLPDVAEAAVRNWIVASLREKKAIIYKSIQLEAGSVTYNRWERYCYNEPRTREVCQGRGVLRFCYPEFYHEYVCKKMPLPNWHQLYIRYTLLH